MVRAGLVTNESKLLISSVNQVQNPNKPWVSYGDVPALFSSNILEVMCFFDFCFCFFHGSEDMSRETKLGLCLSPFLEINCLFFWSKEVVSLYDFFCFILARKFTFCRLLTRFVFPPHDWVILICSMKCLLLLEPVSLTRKVIESIIQLL